MLTEPPSRQIEALKTGLYAYVTLGPLISALFAAHIDNAFGACLLFVCFVATAFLWVRKRLEALEQSVKEQEERLRELSGLEQSPATISSSSRSGPAN